MTSSPLSAIPAELHVVFHRAYLMRWLSFTTISRCSSQSSDSSAEQHRTATRGYVPDQLRNGVSDALASARRQYLCLSGSVSQIPSIASFVEKQCSISKRIGFNHFISVKPRKHHYRGRRLGFSLRFCDNGAHSGHLVLYLLWRHVFLRPVFAQPVCYYGWTSAGT